MKPVSSNLSFQVEKCMYVLRVYIQGQRFIVVIANGKRTVHNYVYIQGILTSLCLSTYPYIYGCHGVWKGCMRKTHYYDHQVFANLFRIHKHQQNGMFVDQILG